MSFGILFAKWVLELYFTVIKTSEKLPECRTPIINTLQIRAKDDIY